MPVAVPVLARARVRGRARALVSLVQYSQCTSLMPMLM